MREGFTLIKSLNLPSNSEAVTAVENLVDEICLELALNEDAYGNVLISVTEALNNAIHHGNKNQEALVIELLVLNNTTEFCFSITDE